MLYLVSEYAPQGEIFGEYQLLNKHLSNSVKNVCWSDTHIFSANNEIFMVFSVHSMFDTA